MENEIKKQIKLLHEKAYTYIEEYIREDIILDYLIRIMETPAPSTTASMTRGRLIKNLLSKNNFLETTSLSFFQNYKKTGNTVIFTGSLKEKKPLWYFAHLDTISYLIKTKQNNEYILTPYCYHLLEESRKVPAGVLRYNIQKNRYENIIDGILFNNDEGNPCFKTKKPVNLQSGDRVYIKSETEYNKENGIIRGNIDNAGVVAALLAAAPVLAELNIDTMLAFPDEEEGPSGKGSQTFARGSSRLIDELSAPKLAIVADMQGGSLDKDSDTAVIGEGIGLAEFSSETRGAVTPPHTYLKAELVAKEIENLGIKVQKNSNYTPRSDDVNVMRKTPNIILLGIPGTDRHYDKQKPAASLKDIVNLSKAFIYYSMLEKLV